MADTFRATWPILDTARSLEELIAEAVDDLPSLRPASYRLMGHRWRIDGNELHLTATALNVDRYGSKLPAEPLLTYVDRTQPTINHRAQHILERAKKKGYLSAYSADKFAVKVLGLHPCLIWGDDWFEEVA